MPAAPPSTKPDAKRMDLLVRVASMYYERDYSQQEIAERLDISRSNISRLLKEAKEAGVIEIRVRKQVRTSPSLERGLMSAFDIDAAFVLEANGADYDTRLAQCGQLGAWYLTELLVPNGTLAIAWGTGVSSVVQALAEQPTLGMDVVQMIGTVGPKASVIDSPELARILSEKIGGNYYYLQAPLFVDSKDAQDIFKRQTAILDTLDRARTAHLALVGIGTTEMGKSSFLRAGHLTEDELTVLRDQGAVGETGGIHFDIEGRADFGINDRVIAITPDELVRIPNVVAVACGLHKVRSIIGALRGGYISVLVTDDITAGAIMDELNA